MSHLDEGTLHAMLDGELEPKEVAEIQAHLGSCSSCGLRLREVREFLDEADRLIASVEMERSRSGPCRRAAAQRETVHPPGADRPPQPPARREPPVRPRAAAAAPGDLERAAAAAADARQRVGGRPAHAADAEVRLGGDDRGFVGAGFIGVRMRRAGGPGSIHAPRPRRKPW